MILNPGVHQQGGPGCPGTEAPYDTPCGLPKRIGNQWLLMSQLWWERGGGQDMILPEWPGSQIQNCWTAEGLASY